LHAVGADGVDTASRQGVARVSSPAQTALNILAFSARLTNPSAPVFVHHGIQVTGSSCMETTLKVLETLATLYLLATMLALALAAVHAFKARPRASFSVANRHSRRRTA
jgi:hypothetical protein